MVWRNRLFLLVVSETTKTGVQSSFTSAEGFILQMDRNAFDDKIDRNSSELYFHYYAQLQHQQNMLQDYIRTGCYYEAITENRIDFEGSAVMDVGAGSGILSLFAAQVFPCYHR